MATVTDSAIFRNIFATPDSREIWSDEKRTQYYLQFEKCLAEAQAELGIVRTIRLDTARTHVLIISDTTKGVQ
jgi:3-carboxy-cis,cis-muconate cycloisomerase